MDLIAKVGEQVKFWSDWKQHYGNGTFERDRSKITFEYMGITYGALVPSGIKPNTIKSATFINNGSLANKESFSVNEKTASTFTWTLKESVGIKIKADCSIPLIGKWGTEMSLNFESTQAQSKTEEHTWTYSADINVAPHKKVITSFVVNEALYKLPFKAKVRARGRVCVSYPGRYPNYVWQTQYWEGEIADMLMPWGEQMFEFDIEGTFEAVHGADYAVTVDEFALALSENAVAGSALKDAVEPNGVVSTVIDLGVLSGDHLHSIFAEVSKKFREISSAEPSKSPV